MILADVSPSSHKDFNKPLTSMLASDGEGQSFVIHRVMKLFFLFLFSLCSLCAAIRDKKPSGPLTKARYTDANGVFLFTEEYLSLKKSGEIAQIMRIFDEATGDKSKVTEEMRHNAADAYFLAQMGISRISRQLHVPPMSIHRFLYRFRILLSVWEYRQRESDPKYRLSSQDDVDVKDEVFQVLDLFLNESGSANERMAKVLKSFPKISDLASIAITFYRRVIGEMGLKSHLQVNSRVTTEDDRKILDMRKKGYEFSEIAEVVGLQASFIRSHIWRKYGGSENRAIKTKSSTRKRNGINHTENFKSKKRVRRESFSSTEALGYSEEENGHSKESEATRKHVDGSDSTSDVDSKKPMAQNTGSELVFSNPQQSSTETSFKSCEEESYARHFPYEEEDVELNRMLQQIEDPTYDEPLLY